MKKADLLKAKQSLTTGRNISKRLFHEIWISHYKEFRKPKKKPQLSSCCMDIDMWNMLIDNLMKSYGYETGEIPVKPTPPKQQTEIVIKNGDKYVGEAGEVESVEDAKKFYDLETAVKVTAKLIEEQNANISKLEIYLHNEIIEPDTSSEKTGYLVKKDNKYLLLKSGTDEKWGDIEDAIIYKTEAEAAAVQSGITGATLEAYKYVEGVKKTEPGNMKELKETDNVKEIKITGDGGATQVEIKYVIQKVEKKEYFAGGTYKNPKFDSNIEKAKVYKTESGAKNATQGLNDNGFKVEYAILI